MFEIKKHIHIADMLTVKMVHYIYVREEWKILSLTDIKWQKLCASDQGQACQNKTQLKCLVVSI